jgi:hypothetical protein
LSALITTAEQITPDWLASVLHISTSSIQQIDIAVVQSAAFSSKWRLHVTYDDDVPAETPTELFLKSGEKYPANESPHEARFYQAIQDSAAGLPVVPCYDVVIEGDWSHILLKDLSQTHDARPPSQMPPIKAECDQIVDALADLHAHWWDHPQLETTFGGAPSADRLRDWYVQDAEDYRNFADFLADRLPAQRRVIYERVIGQLPDLIVSRYAQGNLTLVFEDVHVGNFLYPRSMDDRLYFIDWEQWGVNIGMNDLAYMMALFWSPERRSRLEFDYLRRYFDRILARGITDYRWDDLWYDYRLSVIGHLFVPVGQYTHGGSPEVWWNHIERIFAAYDDLDCDAILG